MSWLALPRKPEPEVMSDAGEVEACASAAAQAYLDAIDNTLVDQGVSLGRTSGWLLDVGTGPGGIPLKITRRLPRRRVAGIDCSCSSVRTALTDARIFFHERTHLGFVRDGRCAQQGTAERA